MNRRDIITAAIAAVLSIVAVVSGFEAIQYAFAAGPPLSMAVSISDPSNNGNQVAVDANGSMHSVLVGAAGGSPVTTSGASDGISGFVALLTGGYQYVFNGTTWDRLRGTANAGMSVAPYGVNQVPVEGNATGTTGAVTGTLAGTAGKTTYICGFNVSAVGTASVGPITVSGILTLQQTYQLFANANGAYLSQTFSPCIPANAANTGISVTTTANASATAVDVNSWGFQL